MMFGLEVLFVSLAKGTCESLETSLRTVLASAMKVKSAAAAIKRHNILLTASTCGLLSAIVFLKQ